MKVVSKIIALLAFIFVMGACKQAVDTTVKKYTVEFNANAETVEGTMEVQTFSKGVAQKLAKSTFTRTGYLFAGWAETETAKTVMYTDEASFTATKNTTLYAVWAETTKFEKPVSGAIQAYTGSELTHNVTGFDTSNMTITGATVGTNVGVYTVTVSLKNSETTWKDNTKEPVTVTWEIVQAVTISFNANGGKHIEDIRIEAGKQIELLPTPEKEYSTFLGWYKDNYHFEKHYSGSEAVTENITLYAKWKSPLPDDCYVLSSGGESYYVDNVPELTTGDIIIADTFNGKPVVEISEKAFERSCIAGISIGKNVKTIGKNAFNYCVALKYVTMSDSVITIDDGAFYCCFTLKTVELSQNLKTIGIGAFSNTYLLEKINLPNTVETIGSNAFEVSHSLTSIVIPKKVTEIGEMTFERCWDAESVILPSNLTKIGYSAFEGCESLKSITLSSRITTIEGYVFKDAQNLTIYAQYRRNKVPSWVGSSGWFYDWNKSDRPVVWGCTLSNGLDEAPYVVAVTKTSSTIEHADDTKTLNAPYREGYTFAGWSSTSGGSVIEGGADALRTATNTTWYAAWTAN